MAEMIPFGKPEGDAAPGQAREEVRSYSNEEVSEIIRVALRSAEESRTNTVGHEEMLTIARDFGLTPGDIARAFEEINLKRDENQLESRAQLTLKIHVLVFAAIQAGLLGINALTGLDSLWMLYPFVAWGSLLAIHGILVWYAPTLVAYALGVSNVVARDAAESLMGAGGADHSARFTLPDVHHGLAQSSGLLQIQDDALLIEFETKDSVFGLLRSGVREVRVPIRDLASARLERQIWNSRLILRGQRLKCFDGIPGHDGGQIKLTLDRNSRLAGERIARELTDRIARG